MIQRQNHLLHHTPLPPAAAYDKARQELYRARHAREIERRVAREEALSTGAFFGAGPLEIGMRLEDGAYEHWRAWAKREIEAQRQLQGSAYTGTENEEAEAEAAGREEVGESESVAGVDSRGQRAEGGAAVQP